METLHTFGAGKGSGHVTKQGAAAAIVMEGSLISRLLCEKEGGAWSEAMAKGASEVVLPLQ